MDNNLVLSEKTKAFLQLLLVLLMPIIYVKK